MKELKEKMIIEPLQKGNMNNLHGIKNLQKEEIMVLKTIGTKSSKEF